MDAYSNNSLLLFLQSLTGLLCFLLFLPISSTRVKVWLNNIIIFILFSFLLMFWFLLCLVFNSLCIFHFKFLQFCLQLCRGIIIFNIQQITIKIFEASIFDSLCFCPLTCYPFFFLHLVSSTYPSIFISWSQFCRHTYETNLTSIHVINAKVGPVERHSKDPSILISILAQLWLYHQITALICWIILEIVLTFKEYPVLHLFRLTDKLSTLTFISTLQTTILRFDTPVDEFITRDPVAA